MFRKTRRLAALVAAVCAVGAISASTASADIIVTPTFTNWHLTGTLTAGGQTFNLDSGTCGTVPGECGFSGNGLININFERIPPIFGELSGETVIPPSSQTLEFPKGQKEFQQAGFSLVASPVHGTIVSTNPALCGGNFTCVNLSIPITTQLSLTIVGPGKGHASKEVSTCQTSAPVELALSTNLTLLEIVAVGSHFEGSTTVPSWTCNSANKGRAAQLTEALSGPASYTFGVHPPGT